MPDSPQPLTLQQIKDGTGFASDALFLPVHPDAHLIADTNPVLRNSILEEREDGCYYTGPLHSGIRVMWNEYGEENLTVLTTTVYTGEGIKPRVFIAEHRGAEVLTFDRSDLADVEQAANQWGQGETEEEAWRYLIGSDFGPLDATYENEDYEDKQRELLGLPPLSPPNLIEVTATVTYSFDPADTLVTNIEEGISTVSDLIDSGEVRVEHFTITAKVVTI